MTASTFRGVVLFLAGATMAALAQAQQAPQGSNALAKAAAPSTSATSQPARKSAADAKAQGSQSAATATPAQKAADSDAQLLRDARNAGFKPETIRGARMFCRTAIELGSNFPVRTCYDEEQTKIKIHEYQVERNQLEQTHNIGLVTH